jgi:SAM-dependent MidA family methyltransferase
MRDDSNPDLIKIITEEIRNKGPMSFRDFMDIALYYPGLGYYTSQGEKIGKKGDYYTSPHLTSVFGEMIGRQILEMCGLLSEGSCGADEEFSIVEMGAGKGLLASDILDFFKKENKYFYEKIKYCIIEVSPWLRERQRDALKDHSVSLQDPEGWYKNLGDLDPWVKGVFISNELVDSFPVHQVVIEDNRLKEVFIDWVGGRFVEVIKEPSINSLVSYFEELGVKLPDGYRTEVNLDAPKWIERIGEILEKGFVITIDYGYLSEELYQSYRSRGTLLCYYKHTTCEDPYIRIGYQDITSHVNFSALIHWAKKRGLEFTGFTDQAHFLINMGIEDYLKALAAESMNYKEYLRKMLPIKNLLMPGMGETFKVLIQHKGMERPSLRGLSFPFRKPKNN